MARVRLSPFGSLLVKLTGREIQSSGSAEQVAKIVAGAVGKAYGGTVGSLVSKLVVVGVFRALKKENGRNGNQGAVIKFRVGASAAAMMIATPIALAAGPILAASLTYPTVHGVDAW